MNTENITIIIKYTNPTIELSLQQNMVNHTVWIHLHTDHTYIFLYVYKQQGT